MKYIKSFEKVKRIYNVGDIVVWNYTDSIFLSKKLSVAPYTSNTEYGDLCEVTEVKGEKGRLYVKLYNKDKKCYVNKFLDNRGQRSTYNPTGHWIEASIYDWFITKPEKFNWTIFTAIQYQKVDIVKKLVKNINDIDIRRRDNKYTPLLLAGFINNLEIIEILIDAGANWNEKYIDSDEDFFYFISDENKKAIIEKYPEKYQDYLTKKEAEKYNL